MLERHKTAIRRYKLSRPLSLAMAHGLLQKDFQIFDYGCGRGEDVTLLAKDGFTAVGWDPHFRPDTALRQAEVVNLGFVLNVIEDLQERRATLFRAYELAEKLLVVSVRVDQSLEGGMPLADGVVTTWGAFQKIFTQAEFRAYLEQVLGAKPIMASLGIAYIFKDQSLEGAYVATLASGRIERWREDVLDSFRKDRIAQRFLKLATAQGRLPLPEEFASYGKLQERFGSPQRITRIAGTILAGADVEAVRARRREELLLYVSMMRLQGLKHPPFRVLPASVQADIKTLWPNYQGALKDGDAFLFQMGNAAIVRTALVGAGLGKVLPDAVYFHRDYANQLPSLVKLILFAASQVVGELDHELVKISLDGRKVSYLRYPTFDTDAHPALEYSVKVHLPTATHTFRDYRDSENPPILHRKETFVDALYPRYSEFQALTAAEESLGLLSRTDIGFRRQWEAVLMNNEVAIRDHELSSTRSTVETGSAPNLNADSDETEDRSSC
jgi:DNA phosphorothioation-associated putative methyltransferase